MAAGRAPQPTAKRLDGDTLRAAGPIQPGSVVAGITEGQNREGLRREVVEAVGRGVQGGAA